MNARDELYEVVLTTIDSDLGILVNQSDLESTADATTDAILAAGYVKHRTITTVEELDALPDDSLVLASGKYLPSSGGDFTDCWIRPIPSHITGGEGARFWEVLIYLDGGVHNMTRANLIALPATVLHEPAP